MPHLAPTRGCPQLVAHVQEGCKLLLPSSCVPTSAMFSSFLFYFISPIAAPLPATMLGILLAIALPRRP